ncbi:cardiolipin synthase [Propionibacterium sp. oral taxon 192]|uniref:cardiolipin synthase n=1 Tax=Propionibacterium sp. oral taxon 192 TaxID=671222 RepID=UPI0012EC77DF|nr:cardiolipin synthase [Propionibacterium sp. oral taxon 192]
MDESWVRSSKAWRAVKIWTRVGVTAVALIAQLTLFVVLLLWFQESASWVTAVSVGVSVLVVAHVLNSRMAIEYKLAWSIVILLMPLFGGIFYVLFGSRGGSRRSMERYRIIQDTFALDQLSAPGAVGVHPAPDLRQIGSHLSSKEMEPVGQVCLPANPARQATMLADAGPFIAYRDTATTYYPVGEDAFADMLEALEGAEHWIALEYFIVADGTMLDQIAEILFNKVKQGVKIWFMYDDWGSALRMPAELPGQMRAAGIKVHAMNKLGLGLTLRYNNRDHRKMLVVDGVTAFTGGINIADEYINAVTRFGHWKDTSIKLCGPGAWGMAALFFTLWEQTSGDHVEIAGLRPSLGAVAAAAQPGSGLVMCYDDDPFDDISLGWDAYRGLMSRATTSIDVMTPYFIPTGEMISVFRAAASSGVRVRLMTPGVPDKPSVYAVTRSNYRPLVEAGVEIYEYTPGFLHAKQMVVDGETAIIGTINFDFRSFFLHQENAVWMYQTPAIADMTADFEKAVAVSRRITLAEVRSVPWVRRFGTTILRTFSVML